MAAFDGRAFDERLKVSHVKKSAFEMYQPIGIALLAHADLPYI